MPDAMGGCPPGYKVFKMKGGAPPCCKRIVARDPPCPKTKKDRKGSRRFISPISGRCVTRNGQILAQARLDKMRAMGSLGPEVVPLGGDDDLGAYAEEAGIAFFGKKRKTVRRYNVPGSPCNRIKKKSCKSKVGCTYVKRRGCRRAKGFAKMVVEGYVPEVNAQVAGAGAAAAAAAAESGASVADQATAAAAAAADAAVANVLSIEGTPAMMREAAEMSAREAAAATGASPAEVRRAVLAIEAAPNFRAKYDALPVDSMERLDFGRRRRRSRFGSDCSTLLPKDISTCLNYRDASGLYPCNWSGGANSRCQTRTGGAVPFSKASTSGKYMAYVMATQPGLAGMSPPPPVVPVAPSVPPPAYSPTVYSGPSIRGLYTCTGRDITACGSNPNCVWQAGAKPPRCIRRAGHLEGQQYLGPIGPQGFGGLLSSMAKSASASAKAVADKAKEKAKKELEKAKELAKKEGERIKEKLKEAAKEELERARKLAKEMAKEQLDLAKAEAAKRLDKLDRRLSAFGVRRARRYRVSGSACQGLRKKVCKASGYCTYVKRRGCRRSAGARAAGLAFGKKRKVYKRSSKKKLPAKIRKLCRKLKIKTTKKVGGRRVTKKISELKKLIARKMRKVHHRR
jgi:hypothetical protein